VSRVALAPVVLLAVLVSGLAGGVAGIGSAALAAGGGHATAPSAPPAATIVAVRGNSEEGYAIRHYDGTADFTPTFDEAFGECGERRSELARVRCRTVIRTWFADLDDLKQALTWAQRT
jgi:hypothetical protein